MANHKSAKKRARQTLKRKLVNKTKMTKARTIVKRLRTAIEAGNKEEASKLLVSAQSAIAKTHLKKNTVSRRTSRLAQQVNKI